MNFNFDSVVAECELLVADSLGSPATLTTLLGKVIENVNVIIKTLDQVMGDDGDWSVRYAGNLGNATAETHFLEVPVLVTDKLTKGSCMMVNGDRYKIMQHMGLNKGFNVFAVIKE